MIESKQVGYDESTQAIKTKYFGDYSIQIKTDRGDQISDIKGKNIFKIFKKIYDNPGVLLSRKAKQLCHKIELFQVSNEKDLNLIKQISQNQN